MATPHNLQFYTLTSSGVTWLGTQNLSFFAFVLLIDTMLDYGFIQKVSPSHDMNCTILTYRIYEL